MVKKIIQIGDERLLQISEKIKVEDIDSDEIQSLATDLLDTAKAHEDSAAGLSAVQIGILKRMFVVKMTDDEDNVSYEILINPEIVEQSREQSVVWEGCMSISAGKKRLFGPVSRSKKVLMSYYDLNGEKQEIEGKDFYAHLLIHELDHLDGKLFLQYVENPKNLWDEKELDKYMDKYGKLPPVV